MAGTDLGGSCIVLRPMLRRTGTSMNCREFKSKHVAYVDDLLSAADMADMRRHAHLCHRCSSLDVRIRRSLMIIRNLPQIEPSADFYARLSERLKTAPMPSPADRLSSLAT